MNIYDIIGPIMVGPSSSHTAGAVRLGNLALAILGEPVKYAVIELHGSFAQTYRGHGTDLALVAGLLGWPPDDLRIPQSFEYAEKDGLEYSFVKVNLGDLAHPNTVRFKLKGKNGAESQITGSSVGGGSVLITDIDGFSLEFTGELTVLLTMHHDKPGVVALVTSILSNQGVNVAAMRLSRHNKGGLAVMVLETDQSISNELVGAIKALPQIKAVRRIQLS
ncbi:L-serine ammonia-lyase, iron-sulfur-dependent subunit beta [Dendrosporobacter sp. 1207_IL3150]|uniref:L-serine ammonia-lyase, iron-sulfur-dependent subunit beta n=1 Tax=Dendrosporobacter sp. 1207_IL3150 TaxID=3084054 RepID=UPI002FDB1E1C